MNYKKKYEKAIGLLQRLQVELAPDNPWWKELFTLTGEHMILTENGWEPGAMKAQYMASLELGEVLSDVIWDEVNQSNT